MIQLGDTTSYVAVFLIAAVFGLLGGLAAELLLNRDGEAGAFELPRRSERYYDIGGFATLIVGAVTGMAILIVFPPAQVAVTTADSGTTVSTGYDTVRLAVTALIAGSAGGSVLTALQSRLSAATAQADIVLKEKVAEQQITDIARMATEGMASLRGGAAPAPGGTRSAGAPPSMDAAVDSAIAAVETRAEQGREAVRSATTRR